MKLTVEEAINGLHSEGSKYVVPKVIFLLSYRISTAVIRALPNFTGQLPYKQWRCLRNSTECLRRTSLTGISRESYCGEGNDELSLVEGWDMVWELGGHPSYVVDWDLMCQREYLGTLITSAYFIGGTGGLLLSSFLFDMFGRVRVTRIAQTMATILTFMMMFTPSMWYQFFVRLLYGSTFFVSDIGYLIIVVELAPQSFRPNIFAVSLILLNFGILFLVLLAYLIENRNYIAGIAGAIYLLSLYPLYAMIPESPLFLLTNKRDENAAKAALTKLSRFYGQAKTFDNVEIVEYKDSTKNKVKDLSLKDTLKDFVTYPVLGKQCGIFVFSWFAFAWIYYGLFFNWGEFGKNIYLNYILNTCSDFIAVLFIYLYFKKCQRRTLAYGNFVTAVALIIAIAPSSIGNDILSLSQVSSLVGHIANGVVLNANYVWVQELTPTTHRGIIMSLASCSSKIGSTLGPQVGLLLAWNKAATLGAFAAAALICGLIMLLLPETKGYPLPSQAKDVVSRAQQVRTERDESNITHEAV